MSRYSFVCLALALVTPACITSSGGADSPPIMGEDVTPRVGAWRYAEVTPVSNSCGAAVDPNQGTGDFAIDRATATSFHVVPGDGTDPFTCTLDNNGGFDCPDRAAAVEDLRPSLDAVFTAHATADGVFSDSTRASGSQNATVNCAGTQCSAAAPGLALPCHFEVSFSIVAR